MVTLASSVIDRVLKKFQSKDTPDILDGAMDTATTTVSYRGFLPAWGPGTVIAIDSERMLVVQVNEPNKTATVVRGYDGTTATTHSLSARIYLEPRGDRSEVLSLINDCLSDLFPELFKVATQEVVYSATAIGYEIPATAYRVLRVSALMNISANLWEPIYDWHIEDQAASEFPSGRAIMLNVSLPSGSKFRVKYGTTFTRASSEADDLEATCGLSDYMTDLPYYYALSRMLPAEEQLRSEIRSAQNHQRAQDVPAFLALRTGEWYNARYLDRKAAAMKIQTFVVGRSIGSGYGS